MLKVLKASEWFEDEREKGLVIVADGYVLEAQPLKGDQRKLKATYTYDDICKGLYLSFWFLNVGITTRG